MAGPRPRSNRPGSAEPSGGARWLAAREKHIRQVNAVSFLNPSRPKRSATTIPEPLRYAQHLPASRIVRILLAVAAPAYVGLQLWEGRSSLEAAIGIAILLLAVIFIVSTLRLSVSNYGVSFDIAGIRQVSSFGFVPLYAIRDARAGRPAADWPKASLKGGWWPGRSRVSVWYVDENATASKAFSVWVSDVNGFGTAVLGRRMSDPD